MGPLVGVRIGEEVFWMASDDKEALDDDLRLTGHYFVVTDRKDGTARRIDPRNVMMKNGKVSVSE